MGASQALARSLPAGSARSFCCGSSDRPRARGQGQRSPKVRNHPLSDVRRALRGRPRPAHTNGAEKSDRFARVGMGLGRHFKRSTMEGRHGHDQRTATWASDHNHCCLVRSGSISRCRKCANRRSTDLGHDRRHVFQRHLPPAWRSSNSDRPVFVVDSRPAAHFSNGSGAGLRSVLDLRARCAGHEILAGIAIRW